MVKAGVKEARRHLSEYLSRVKGGEEIIITKRDEPVAKLVPIQKKKRLKSLGSHKKLRDAIKPTGKPLSEIVCESREERF